VRWDLGKADGSHASGGVTTDFGGRFVGIPQWNEAQRQQGTIGVATPLLDHPIVVGHDAGFGELAILGFEKGLATEAGKEGSRGLLRPSSPSCRRCGPWLVTAGRISS